MHCFLPGAFCDQVQEEAARQQAPSYGKQGSMGAAVGAGAGGGPAGVGPGAAQPGAVLGARADWAARYRAPPPLHHAHHARLPLHQHHQPLHQPHQQHPPHQQLAALTHPALTHQQQPLQQVCTTRWSVVSSLRGKRDASTAITYLRSSL